MGQPLRRPLLEQVQDVAARQSIEWLHEYLRNALILKGEFEHREYTISVGDNLDGRPFAHGLPFTPRDAFLTFVSDNGATSARFLFSKFDATNIYIASSNSAPITVRLFVGRFENGF